MADSQESGLLTPHSFLNDMSSIDNNRFAPHFLELWPIGGYGAALVPGDSSPVVGGLSLSTDGRGPHVRCSWVPIVDIADHSRFLTGDVSGLPFHNSECSPTSGEIKNRTPLNLRRPGSLLVD